MMSPQVQVLQGMLQGRLCTGYNGVKYYSFEGIPYAKPPVGNLRFKEPQEPENWTGVRDATKPGNKCTQMNRKGFIEGSEDCLYLNVYTPSLPVEKIEKLPVIFFVHGGGLINGYGDYYQPDYFIRHDVIVVTINYRLHVLGFLCLNTREVPGNAALKDTVTALKWVRNNIRNFNGDPNNITAFGESAGGGSVAMYLTSKMADGLYHKVIAESGTSVSDVIISNDDAIANAKNLATILGEEVQDERSLYDFLMNVPVEDLVFAVIIAETSKSANASKPIFSPVLEKSFDGVESFLEEYPIVDIRRNRFNIVPCIVGLNSHEGALFLRKDSEGNIIYENDLGPFMPSFSSYKPDDRKRVEFAMRAKQFYFKTKPINDSAKEEYVDFISDAYLNRGLLYFCELVSKYSNHFYFFNFAYYGGMNTGIMSSLGMKGASHGDILPYQFYRENKAKICTDDDNKIVDFLSETWCNFAKNGKPTWTNQPVEWLPYTSTERNYLRVDKEITMEKDLYKERFDFWKSYMEEKSKL